MKIEDVRRRINICMGVVTTRGVNGKAMARLENEAKHILELASKGEISHLRICYINEIPYWEYEVIFNVVYHRDISLEVDPVKGWR